MTQWEYKEINIGAISYTEVCYNYMEMLNEAGKDGWELICIINKVAILKKQKQVL